jgi:hypothetical protein
MGPRWPWWTPLAGTPSAASPAVVVGEGSFGARAASGEAFGALSAVVWIGLTPA